MKPDLDLGLGEVERQRQVEPLADRQVPGRLELVLQGHELLVGEGRPGSPGFRRFRVARPLLARPVAVFAWLVSSFTNLRSPVVVDLWLVSSFTEAFRISLQLAAWLIVV